MKQINRVKGRTKKRSFMTFYAILSFAAVLLGTFFWSQKFPSSFFVTAQTVTTYYVSPTGNDSNAGTSSSKPWKTLQRVNAQNFSPGTSILFQGGKTFTGK